jgi:hypothetical protein
MVRRVSPMERKILLFIEGATAVGVRGEKRSKTSGREHICHNWFHLAETF